MAFVMILLGWLLDILSIKRVSDKLFIKYVRSSDPSYPVHRAIWALMSAGRTEEAGILAAEAWEKRGSARIGRDYIHLLLKHRDIDQAFRVSQDMAKRWPDVPWIRMLAADICSFFVGDEDRALGMYLETMPLCEAAMPDIYPQAVLYKRLTSIYRRRADHERLVPTLEWFYRLAPTNFHDDEFILLAEYRLQRGDRDGAKEVLETACLAMARNIPVRQAYERMGFGEAPCVRQGARAALSSGAMCPEATCITLKTRLLTEADDSVEVARTYALGKAETGDVVALSSCVGAIMEGRMMMEGVIRPCFLARFIASLIARCHRIGAFDASAPMSNPLSVQTALEEVGTLRLVVAAVIGAVGKAFGKRGWFYMIAGAQVAQIDDILGSVPPYDYYVMLGPKDPSASSDRIAAALGQGVKAAIVDANDLGIAWVVGASDGVAVKTLESAMSGNPAGNQDQMTPLVIVRTKAKTT